MLVLSRKKDEVIEIGCPDGTLLRIILVAVLDNKVRLGFDCPIEYSVHRKEVADKIREEKANESVGEGQPGREASPPQSASWPPRTCDSVD
jgi:carbon storage regulator CsrA